MSQTKYTFKKVKLDDLNVGDVFKVSKAPTARLIEKRPASKWAANTRCKTYSFRYVHNGHFNSNLSGVENGNPCLYVWHAIAVDQEPRKPVSKIATVDTWVAIKEIGDLVDRKVITNEQFKSIIKLIVD
tara:strand:- start:7 stop:393 length:387 start_codon:yes stop_codon:yes gene_type:complete